MAKPHDLVIIGAGTAAMTAAMQVRAAGWQVAVIDFRPFGGTCALRGCDPKKMLIGGVDALAHARRMRDHGVVGELHIDWQKLMAFKRAFTDPMPQKIEQRYQDQGVDTYHGTARFTGTNTVQVEGEHLEAKYILIASGAEPLTLNIPGEQYLMTMQAFLRWKRYRAVLSWWAAALLRPSSRILQRMRGRKSRFCSKQSGCSQRSMPIWSLG